MKKMLCNVVNINFINEWLSEDKIHKMQCTNCKKIPNEPAFSDLPHQHSVQARFYQCTMATSGMVLFTCTRSFSVQCARNISIDTFSIVDKQ